MAKQNPKKHHFIPQFYIKGFADENMDVFVYDKEYKKVARVAKKSSQIFYEIHLHTVKKFGETSLLIEDSYSELEGMFSQIVTQISKWPSEILPEIVKDEHFAKLLIFMMSVQYWRNPQNTDAAKELGKNLVSLYDQAIKTNIEFVPFSRKDIKYFQKKSTDEAVQKFVQFLLLPLITFKLHPAQLKGLKVVRLKNENEFLCSDTPVMIDSIDSEFNFKGQVLYPLTKHFAITNVEGNTLLDFDTVILSHARKKIIASSTERLNSLPLA
ncbi:DUF4238 domain-containing protein [Vibrio sp. OPT20]|uniref:DUF4238 domain-containing protein n=1 Tax=Vibrio sp. OPT20 TaxID=2778642 RepID=UPI00187EAF4E|nr:DUF4238 domain-containing protein [Vibrio sp. OPT20]MBE8566717.1 DUF4238 domain-containing protein [Vibrio sp. OPT20]